MVSHQQLARVAVLCGGTSDERSISMASGRCVAAALRAARFDVVLFDPAAEPLEHLIQLRIDVCFLALHGGEGEDGTLQAHLDRLGIPYTGSGPAASRLAMSKSAAKRRWLEFRIPTAAYRRFRVDEPVESIERRCASLGYPLIVKPDAQGSSLGIVVVHKSDEWPRALQVIQNYGPKAIAEPYIIGREFTVALIDGEPLPLLEITSGTPIFDYRTKYFTPKPPATIASNLPSAVARSLVQAGQRAAEALGTRGLVRVDLMLDERDAPWVLEVNTIPGLTEHSLVPLAARSAGYEMPNLCARLVKSCLCGECIA